MSEITTHVLDTTLGLPAAGIPISLEELDGGTWTAVAQSSTDANGRCRDLAADVAPGHYRLTFHLRDYFARQGRVSLYPEVVVVFHIVGEPHYHLPVLLSDNSYTTYRGS